MNYWETRNITAQQQLTKKTEKEIKKQLGKYYRTASHNLVGQFHIVYNKVFSDIENGNKPTPADLYKLDAYWKLQGQVKEELQRLGDKQTILYIKRFTKFYENVYNSLPLRDRGNFSTLDKNFIEQTIKRIWCADGKSWSDRIWTNTDELQQALNEEMISCLTNGLDSSRLKDRLMYDFNVSYNRADTLVRTEIAHIQTQATQQRYEDAGIKQVYVWADEDERRCDICGKLHEKKFFITDTMPVPAHPRCRCRILPVLD